MDLDKLTKEELVSELSRRGEDARGRKPVLLERLREILKEEQFHSGGAMNQAKDEKDKLQEDQESKKVEDDESSEAQSKSAGGGATSFRPASSIRTTSSMASARAMERAKLAGLSAKKQALKRKHLLEAQEAELRHMREEIELQAEIEECEAREKVFEEMMTEEHTQHVRSQPQENVYHQLESRLEAGSLRQGVATKPQVTGPTGLQEVATKPQVTALKMQEVAVQLQEKKPHAASLLQEAAERPQDSVPLQQEVAAGPQESASMHQATDFIRHDIRMARKLQLPALDLTVFQGDSAKYKPFMKAFQANIARNVDCEAEKLLYLLKFTQGKPHDIVQTCVHLPEERGYSQAIKLLNSRYDTGVYAVTSLISQMQNLPILRADDAEALDDLSIFLRGCLNAFETQPYGLRSVDPKTMCKLLEKMPHHMIEKWRRLVDDIEHEERRQANFRDLVEYIEKEARIAMNPSYGRHVLGSGGRLRSHEARKTDTLAGKKTVVGRTLAGSIQPMANQTKCFFCEGMHKTESCKKLQEKTPEERTKFVKEKGLCFACLQHGHRSRFCKERRTCEKCGRSHPTVLHFHKPENPTVTAGHLAPSSKGGGKLQVLKVRVGFSERKVTTNAFLDSGSTHSFISRHLLDELGMKPQMRTPLKVSTISGEQTMNSSIVPGLLIEDLDQDNVMELPPLYVLDRIPVVTDDVPSQEDVERWTYLQEASVTLRTLEAEEEIGLLIGGNAGSVMEPLDFCPSQDGGPYAILTRFGWVLGGLKNEWGGCRVNRIKVNEYDAMAEEWFENRAETRKGLSVEDIQWCAMMETGCVQKDHGYEIKMPFREKEPQLGNNREVAEKRLDSLKRKFEKEETYAAEYTAQMSDMLQRGYIEEAPELQEGASKWYLPHFGVQSPTKKKVRVVFDCAAKHNGRSLNDSLLQGPDLTNPVFDVLVRFREQPYAFTGDIEAMFMQVHVPENQRDYLRFLWWPEGDVSAPPKEYRNTRHLFGAKSSPSCANLALHKTAEDHGVGKQEASDTIRRNFYVDDVLKSVESEEAAVNLVRGLRDVCASGGFNLTKFSSNSTRVLGSVASKDRASDVKKLEPNTEVASTERALGVLWDTKSDTFGFQIDVDKLKKKPVTKRGMLSAAASCYDPLGLAAPYLIRGRMCIQELFRLKVPWDSRVPDQIGRRWERWLLDLSHLENFRIPRCLSAGDLYQAKIELHHFADASQTAYGTVSYMRTAYPDGSVHCRLLTSKARVAPLKSISIPRLELTAAKLAVQVSQDLSRALDTAVDNIFWTDSTTVMKYIRNTTTRFHVFVSNRLAVIHDGSSVGQWRYVPSELNPADLVSRGTNVSNLIESDFWKQGPRFLLLPSEDWPTCPGDMKIESTDPEVKAGGTSVFSKVTASATVVSDSSPRGATASTATSQHQPVASEKTSPVQKLLQHYSSWRRVVRAVALLRRVFTKLKEKCRARAELDASRRQLAVTSGPGPE